MTRAAIAAAIRGALNMAEVAAYYGVDVPLGGRMACCPLHRDKNASLKLFDDGFKCFGCGAHGDQIDFVMALLGVDFWTAAGLINQDFGLGLVMDAPADDCARRRAKQLARRRLTHRQAQARAEARYWQAYDRWLLCARIQRDCPPLTALWCWAVNRMDTAQMDLDDAQAQLSEVRKARV